MRCFKSETVLAAACCGVIAISAGEGIAEQERDGSWAFGGEIYLWGAAIGTETLTGDSVDLSFRDILQNLNFAAMATLAARRDRWTLFSDVVYLDAQNNRDLVTGTPTGGVAGLSRGIGLQSFISTTGAGYRVYEGPATKLNAIAATRYLWANTSLSLNRGFGGVTFSESQDAWDGVVGLRGETVLSDDWSLSYYGDVGGGQSDFTGQVLVSANYSYRQVKFSFGYRHLYWDLRDFGPLETLEVSGPFAGVRFTF